MPVFKIEVSREVRALEWADVEIEADTIEEALAITRDMCDDGDIENHTEFFGDPENVYAKYFPFGDYE